MPSEILENISLYCVISLAYSRVISQAGFDSCRVSNVGVDMFSCFSHCSDGFIPGTLVFLLSKFLLDQDRGHARLIWLLFKLFNFMDLFFYGCTPNKFFTNTMRSIFVVAQERIKIFSNFWRRKNRQNLRKFQIWQGLHQTNMF